MPMVSKSSWYCSGEGWNVNRIPKISLFSFGKANTRSKRDLLKIHKSLYNKQDEIFGTYKDLCRGVHIMTIHWEDKIPRILDTLD